MRDQIELIKRRKSLMEVLCRFWTTSSPNLDIGIYVTIGGSETEIIVNGFTGVVHSQALRVAGNAMDEAITQHIERKYKLQIGNLTAEALKIRLGSATSLETRLTMNIRARRLSDGEMENACITDEDVREALTDVVRKITDAVMVAVKSIPAEMSAVVASSGITLKGKGGLLRNMDLQLMSATGLVVKRA